MFISLIGGCLVALPLFLANAFFDLSSEANSIMVVVLISALQIQESKASWAFREGLDKYIIDIQTRVERAENTVNRTEDKIKGISKWLN